MANSIASAKRYINNDAELERLFKSVSFTADLEKENKAVGAQTVMYRKVTFGDTVLGTFNRETGYVRKNIEASWEEKRLTQDKGNSLVLDKMDGEEAQGLEIVTVHNKFIREVVVPAVDKYRFSAIVGTDGVTTTTADLDETSIEAAIDADLDALYNIGVRDNVVLYISTSANRLLKKAAKKTGTLQLGTWGGSLTADVKVYGDTIQAKVIQVPDSILGNKVQYILLPTPAFAGMVKYQENAYFDQIPGFGGRRAQVDSGIYHDGWVEPGAEAAVFIHKEE